MPYFPLFINLQDCFCLVIGGGVVAARKVQTLLQFDAVITVLDPCPSDAICSLEQEERIRVKRQSYQSPTEMSGALMVVAATNDWELNQRIAEDAKTLKIPVNVSDNPDLCTFFFPALLRRGNLVVGISTSGSCPRLAVRLRQQLEGIWPPDLGKALEDLSEARRELRKTADSATTLRRLDRLITRLFEEMEGSGAHDAAEDKRVAP
jgi:siroheme synthase-like protein